MAETFFLLLPLLSSSSFHTSYVFWDLHLGVLIGYDYQLWIFFEYWIGIWILDFCLEEDWIGELVSLWLLEERLWRLCITNLIDAFEKIVVWFPCISIVFGWYITKLEVVLLYFCSALQVFVLLLQKKTWLQKFLNLASSLFSVVALLLLHCLTLKGFRVSLKKPILRVCFLKNKYSLNVKLSLLKWILIFALGYLKENGTPSMSSTLLHMALW